MTDRARRPLSHCYRRSLAGARLVSRQQAVQVKLERGATPSTDGQRIVLPAPPRQLLEGKHAIEDHRASLAHEAGHVRHTDTAAYRGLSPMARRVFNYLEDIRIDRLVRQDYRGYGRDLRRSAARYGRSLRQQIGAGQLHPIEEVLVSLLVEHALGRCPELSGAARRCREQVASELERFRQLADDPDLRASTALTQVAASMVRRWAEPAASWTWPQTGTSWHEVLAGAGAEPDRAEEAGMEGKVAAGGGDALDRAAAEPTAALYTPCTDTDQIGPCKDTDAGTYQRDLEAVQRQLPALRRVVRQALQDHRRSREIGGQRRGERLDPQALWKLPALGETRVFESRVPGSRPDAAFVVLVDESGSMQGKPIEMARQAALLLATVLGQLQIPVLVAGHSTCERLPLSGDEAARVQQRHRAGFTRCDSLLLNIYKGFQEPLCRAGPRIAVMQARNHNVDGEAVLQAILLLAKRRESHRHLICLSDGAPECSLCPEPLLADHLRTVVSRAAAAGLAVTGVGMCTDAVHRFYPGWIGIERLEDLASALVGFVWRALAAAPRRPVR